MAVAEKDRLRTVVQIKKNFEETIKATPMTVVDQRGERNGVCFPDPARFGPVRFDQLFERNVLRFGGTCCSAPLKYLNDKQATGDLIIYVSDNESWIDSRKGGWGNYGPTATMKQWNLFKTRSPNAKMVCIDIQPYGSTQAKESPDIVNVGGFSDQVFTLIAEVASGAGANHWINSIEKIEL